MASASSQAASRAQPNSSASAPGSGRAAALRALDLGLGRAGTGGGSVASGSVASGSSDGEQLTWAPKADMAYLFRHAHEKGAGGGGGGGGKSASDDGEIGVLTDGDLEPVSSGGSPRIGFRRRCLRSAGQAVEAVTGKISSHFSLRRRLSIIMLGSPLGRFWDLFQVLMSLLSCFLYVASTYGADQPYEIDWTITILFSIDYVLRFFIANNRLAYPFSFFAIVDIVACMPVYLEWANVGGNSSLRFVRFLRVLRVLRIIRAFRMIAVFSSASSKALLTLALSIVCMIFLGAGVFNVVETQEFETFANGRTDRSTYVEPSAPDEMSFLDGCYFMVVTIFTVGYGDFFPITVMGRIVVILTIILSIVIFPILIEDVRTSMASVSAFRIQHVAEVEAPHALVLGVCESAHPKIVMRDLMAELFHHQRTSGLPSSFANALCLLLGNFEPPPQITQLLNNPLLSGRLKYVRGSAFRREDLMRAAIAESSSIFLMCDASLTSGPDAKLSDTVGALRAIMAKAHAPRVPTLMLVHDPQTVLVMDTDDSSFHVASAFDWRAHMLAGTSLIPGFAALLSTLVHSSSAPTGKLAVKKVGPGGTSAAPPGDASHLEPWQIDAAISMASRLGVGPVPDELDGISFSELASLVYEKTGGDAVAIAVSELPALTYSAAGIARVADLQRRFADKTLLAEDLLHSMGFLPQEAVIAETRAVQGKRDGAEAAAFSASASSPLALAADGGGKGGGDGDDQSEAASAVERQSSSRSLSSFDSSTTSAAKGVRVSTIEREVVMGKVLLNPGEAYRVRGGQFFFIVSANDAAVETAFRGSRYDRARDAAPQLPAEDREAEEGYGYPAAWLASNVASMARRTASRAQMLRRASLHKISQAVSQKEKAKALSAEEQAKVAKAAAAYVAPTAETFAESLNTMAAVDKALRPIVCRDARTLASPRAEGHVIISCSINEAALLANAVRRRIVLDEKAPALILLLLKVADLERCTLSQAHELLGIDRALIVIGSADHAEALGRCAVEHARSIVLSLGGSGRGGGADEDIGYVGGSRSGEGGDGVTGSSEAEAKRSALLAARDADLAFQFSSVLRVLSKIRARRATAAAARHARALAQAQAAPASSGSAASAAAAKVRKEAPWEGPTVVLELRAMDDIFLIDTTATESMAQLEAQKTAGITESREGSSRNLQTLRTAARSESTRKMLSLATMDDPAGGADAKGPGASMPPPSQRAAALGVASDVVKGAAAALSTDPLGASSPRLQRRVISPRNRAEIEGATGSPLAFSTAIWSGGNLYANSLTYALLASFYYCPMSSAVLSELLSPSITRGGSVVESVGVPKRFSRLSYADLVEELRLKHDAVAIGLYRYGVPLRDGPGGPRRYTLVHPPPSTPLYSSSDGCDSVFVLAHKHVLLE